MKLPAELPLQRMLTAGLAQSRHPTRSDSRRLSREERTSQFGGHWVSVWGAAFGAGTPSVILRSAIDFDTTGGVIARCAAIFPMLPVCATAPQGAGIRSAKAEKLLSSLRLQQRSSVPCRSASRKR